MLKGIPDIISPRLLMILDEMGHGDDIVIGDGNFPATSNARNLISCNGHGVVEILDAILSLFPLDEFVDKPVTLMKTVNETDDVPIMYKEISQVVSKHYSKGDSFIDFTDRFAFYEKAKNAYAIVSTSEKRLYGCVILKKGIII